MAILRNNKGFFNIPQIAQKEVKHIHYPASEGQDSPTGCCITPYTERQIIGGAVEGYNLYWDGNSWRFSFRCFNCGAVYIDENAYYMGQNPDVRPDTTYCPVCGQRYRYGNVTKYRCDLTENSVMGIIYIQKDGNVLRVMQKNGPDGTIDGILSYAWNTGETTKEIVAASSGTYVCNVTIRETLTQQIQTIRISCDI